MHNRKRVVDGLHIELLIMPDRLQKWISHMTRFDCVDNKLWFLYSNKSKLPLMFHFIIAALFNHAGHDINKCKHVTNYIFNNADNDVHVTLTIHSLAELRP